MQENQFEVKFVAYGQGKNGITCNPKTVYVWAVSAHDAKDKVLSAAAEQNITVKKLTARKTF